MSPLAFFLYICLRLSPNKSSCALLFCFFLPNSFGLICRLPAQTLSLVFCLPDGSSGEAFSIYLKLPPCFSICSFKNLLPMPIYEL